MFWQEEIDEERFTVPDNVVDLIFKINCPTLPVDHAWELSEAIHQALPWFATEHHAGLHLIYGAESGNGWKRPTDSDEPLYLSRRTPLILRLPHARIDDAMTLTGCRFDISGHKLEIGEGHTRLLGMTTTLFCRNLVTGSNQTEEDFLQSTVAQLEALNLQFKKVLCGKGTCFNTPDGLLQTQSLMIAGIPLDDAVTLQEEGIGPLRSRGFGLFIPHKTV